MSCLSFAAADALHNYAVSRSIIYHSVEHPLFQEFWLASRHLEASIRAMGSDDDLLRQLLRVARVRFELAVTPLGLGHSFFLRQLRELNHEAVIQRVSMVYPSLASLVSRFRALLRGLVSSEETPLLDELEHLIVGESRESIVIREERLVGTVQSFIRSRAALSHCTVIGVNELRAARLFRRLFFIGSTSWFPDHTFSAPRTPEIHVVSYKWLSRQWEPKGVFLASATSREENKDLGHSRFSASLDSWPELDWEEIARRALQDSPGAKEHGYESVEGRLFLLGGGLAVFLDTSSHSRPLVIDPEADDAARVRRVMSDEIEVGMFLLQRTEGGGDYILPLADQILGERSESYRAKQRNWKENLIKAISQSHQADFSLRLLDVSLRLLDLGAIRADETNLRYWTSTRSISPRDRRDFHAIMKLVGLESYTDEYWVVMRQILAAHHEAGRRIRRGLLQCVRTIDLSQLERRGRIDISLSDQEGGKLSAFLVEERAPDRILVPSSWEGRIFEREA